MKTTNTSYILYWLMCFQSLIPTKMFIQRCCTSINITTCFEALFSRKVNPCRVSNSSSFFIRAENPNTSQQVVDDRFVGLFTTFYEFFRVWSTVSIGLDVKHLLWITRSSSLRSCSHWMTMNSFDGLVSIHFVYLFFRVPSWLME
jgi:hypothetical protein